MTIITNPDHKPRGEGRCQICGEFLPYHTYRCFAFKRRHGIK